LLLKIAKPHGRRIELGPRLAENRVAAPAQVAKRDISFGVPNGQESFPIPVLRLTLDECAAEEDDTVAVY
jgi:hypothetical protein